MAFWKRKNQDEAKDPTSSKIYIFFEWLWRIFVLNCLTLVTSIGIITILPSFVACFRTIKDCYENDETHYIKAFFKNFAYCFLDTLAMSITLLVVFALFTFAYIFYNEAIQTAIDSGTNNSMRTIYSILLGFTIIFSLILLIAIVQLPAAITYFHFRYIDKIKFIFYMAYRYLGISGAMLLITIVDVIVTLYLPYLAFVFSFSLPMLCLYLITRRTYWSISQKMGFIDYEEDKYDMHGKVQNKETYEDVDKNAINEKAVNDLKKFNDEITKGAK